MRSNAIRNRILALIMTVLMVFGTAVCDDTANVFGATFSAKSPFKIYNDDTKKTETRTYNHNSNFQDNIILNGVDVSAYQSGSKSNYNTAKKNGVDYAIIRATFTYVVSGKMEEDSQWTEHFDKARAAGLMTGLYCFSQATSKKEAKAEANLICDVYEKHIKDTYGSTNYNAYLDMPIYIDYEKGDGYRINKVSKTNATSYINTFCQTIAERGYTPGIYACRNDLNNSMDGAALGQKYEIWAAEYGPSNNYKSSDYAIWQYSSAARIGGLLNSSGSKCNIDVNFWYLDKNRSGIGNNDIANCTFSGAATVKYTGSVLAPEYTIKSGDTKLKKGTDYTIGYANNIKLGTGYAYIRGIGQYSGYKVIPFEITDQDIPEENVAKEGIAEQVDIGELEDIELVKPEDCITLSASGKKAGYKLANETLSEIVAGTKASAVKSAVAVTDKYDGYNKKVVDKNGETVGSSKIVTSGDKLAIYGEDGKVIEVATLKVKGTAAKFTSVKGGKKKITVKWKKIASSKATGYQIQYCQYKDMPAQYSETKTIKSYKTTSVSLKTNFDKRNYYVKIRSYKTIRDKKNYSSWSSVKSVKVK